MGVFKQCDRCFSDVCSSRLVVVPSRASRLRFLRWQSNRTQPYLPAKANVFLIQQFMPVSSERVLYVVCSDIAAEIWFSLTNLHSCMHETPTLTLTPVFFRLARLELASPANMAAATSKPGEYPTTPFNTLPSLIICQSPLRQCRETNRQYGRRTGFAFPLGGHDADPALRGQRDWPRGRFGPGRAGCHAVQRCEMKPRHTTDGVCKY
jgi:hypothetical protein